MLVTKNAAQINLMIQLLAFMMRDRPCMVEFEKTSAVISFMREIHRVLKVGGIVEIYCPHYTSKNAFADFTHQYFVTEDTFSYFCREGKHRNFGTIYGIDFEFVEQHCGTYKESPESNLDIYFRLEKV